MCGLSLALCAHAMLVK